MAQGKRSLEQRFWDKIVVGRPDECWPWTAGDNGSGYGRLFVEKGRKVYAHRFAYALAAGKEPPADLCVCHRCDNPPCCNPAHLFLGSKAENNADMAAKGRARPPTVRGEQHGLSRLSEDDVREIRASYAAGGRSQRALARQFGVDQALIWMVIHRKAWAHVT